MRGHAFFARTIRRIARPSLVLTLFLTGCVAVVHQDQSHTFDSEAAAKVFAAGYSIIQDKYIEPISSSRIATAGLTGLSTLDAGVTVTVRDGVIHLSFPDGVAVDVAAPADQDSQTWATATTAAISIARAHSKLIAERGSEDIYQAIFRASLAEFDRFSRYLSATAARRARATRDGYGGIGVMLNFNAGQVTVDAIMPETPAARAGLKAGDTLVEIDHAETASMTEADVVDRLRGRVASQVSLTVRRADMAESLTVTLSRTHIVNPTVELERRGDVAVIKLSGFNHGTSQSVSKALERIHADMGKSLKGLVLDMRDNPGGLLDQAISVSDQFLSSGRIVSTKGRHAHSVQVYDATGHDRSFNLPMVVLVNGRSASAAEIVAAALQDDGRAVVVGSNTYGKGTVQNLSPLPNDGELVLTWSVYHAPSGYSLHNLGVLPNVCTSGFRGKADEVLDQSSPAWARLPILMAAWRAASPAEGVKLDSMRENCPRSSEVRDFEVDVAARLIADPALYRRALQTTGSTVVAGPLQ